MRKNKVLIVDDDPEIRRLLSAFFEKKGFDALSLESGLLGLNILAGESFDCLISDINMPFMDGVEFTRRARELDSELAIILLTGYGSLESAQEAIKTGVQGYLTKPVDFDKLHAEVEHGLAQIAESRLDAQRYRKLAEELKNDKNRLDSMKEELTTLISHELRTPVAVISESFSLLKDAVVVPDSEKIRTFTDADKQRLFEFLERGHRRLITLIENISYYMNLKNKAVTLKHSEVILNDFLDESFQGFERLLSGSNAILKKEFAQERLKASLDKEKFLDVLARIINNAVRHNPEGVEIILKLSTATSPGKDAADSKYAKVEISDNGKGIEKEVLERIYNPFNVGNIKEHGRGTGLGMAICKEVVELHGGKINVANRKEKGAIISIELPLI